ncbi:MAG TPA: STAS domain-containing protein [Candidatus Dormibacteraeota bacterium]|nr:STAS domain-containing protein [Candidatus Dormibacteraeota bacterium]
MSVSEGIQAEPCEVSVSRQNGWVVLRVVEEEIDLYMAENFKAAIQGEMKDAVPMVIDLSQVKYLDSMTLGALVTAHKQVRHLGGLLHIVSSYEGIARMFEITGLHRVFELFDTLESATASKPGV